MRFLAGFGAGTRYGVHANNVQNLARGIVERVLHVVVDGCLARAPQPLIGVFDSRLGQLRKRLVSVLRPTPVVPISAYPELYHGRKKQIYQRAVDSLMVRAVTSADARVKTFVKAEKVNLSNKVDPAPRVIQPRDPRYTASVGRYLKPFEGQLCYGFKQLFGYPVILKGLNADQVGTQLYEHWASFSNPVGIGLDATRFDQHVSVDALKFEHSVYNSVFRSRELATLLRMQLHNVGRGRAVDGVVHYAVDGCRMSGDINTGMGNCLLMALIVLAYFEHVGVQAKLGNNGDDCVVICESRDLNKFDGIDSWFKGFGFTLTREEPVYVLEQLEFCQARPVWVSGGYRMVRNPWTATSKDCVSVLSWDTPLEFSRWAGAISSCGLSLTSGVPVWEQWYTALSRLGTNHAASDAVVRDSGLGYMARGVREGYITDRGRFSFWLAYGLTPDDQEAVEAQCAAGLQLTGTRRMMYPNIENLDNFLLKWLRTAKGL